jgi:predicted SAM-dependent methyltransferase
MAWRAQAMALLRLGRLGDAELTCLKGLRKIGSNAELLATLATLRMAQARLEESDTLFARALAANPDLAEAYANRARLRDRQGRPEEAVPDLVRAVEIKPWLRSSADIATRLHLAELLAQGSATTDLRTVLHVGCGPKHDFSLYPAFKSARWREIRLDIDPAVAPDIVASITNMATVASASVEVVWSSHNLEHLYDHEIPRALREFRRVLKPGGALLLVVPDFLRVAELFASGRGDDLVYVSASGPVYPLDMAFGMRSEIAKGHTSMTHHTAFTPTRLEKILDSAGFTHLLIQRDDNFNIWATSRSPGPE